MIWYRLYRLRLWRNRIMYKLGWVPRSDLERLLKLLKDIDKEK